MAVRLITPDGSAWAIDTAAAAGGVELAIAFTLDGQPITARFALDRPDARTLAHSLLADAGDATMRTLPKPAEVDHA